MKYEAFLRVGTGRWEVWNWRPGSYRCIAECTSNESAEAALRLLSGKIR